MVELMIGLHKKAIGAAWPAIFMALCPSDKVAYST
jgi:hypothetical protein